MFRTLILFLLIPLFKLVYVFLKISNKKIGYINISRFGEAVFEYYLLKNYIDKQTSIIFYQTPISNSFLLKLIKKEKRIHKINIIVREFINYLIVNNYESVLILNHHNNKDIYYNAVQDHGSLYDFSIKERDEARRFFVERKLNTLQNFICIHNRDNSYLEGLDNRIDFSYHNYRNFSINDFSLSFEQILKNFIIVRTGIISNEKINSNSKLIIDMPFIKHSSFLSFYFLANCQYYIGSDSGAWTIPYLFKKPIFFINFSINISDQQLINCTNTSMIFKKIYSINLSRYLNLSEIIDLNLIGKHTLNSFKKRGLEVHNNSKDEIYDYIREIKLSDNKIIYRNEDHFKLSTRFWNIIIEKLNLKIRKKKFPIIGYSFLKNNLNLLK